MPILHLARRVSLRLSAGHFRGSTGCHAPLSSLVSFRGSIINSSLQGSKDTSGSCATAALWLLELQKNLPGSEHLLPENFRRAEPNFGNCCSNSQTGLPGVGSPPRLLYAACSADFALFRGQFSSLLYQQILKNAIAALKPVPYPWWLTGLQPLGTPA